MFLSPITKYTHRKHIRLKYNPMYSFHKWKKVIYITLCTVLEDMEGVRKK